MQLKWLEDFVMLAETRSFSVAAQQRNVTQPAFGRRIRALEDWMRVELVDREAHRPALTAAGKLFLDLASEIVQRLEDTRTMLHEEQRQPASTLTVAASHTLGVHYYPRFISELEANSVGINSNLAAVNSHEGILMLVDGGCDLLISYHHPELAVTLDRDRFPYLRLGADMMVPMSAPGPDGAPLHCLPGTPDAPVQYLSYSPSIFMGRAVSHRLKTPPQPLHLRPSYTTDMSQALKAMMLEGRGLGWLPWSSVESEVRQGRLVCAVPPGTSPKELEAWTAPLELRVYRSATNRKAVLNDLWDWLVERYGDATPQRPAQPRSTGLVGYSADARLAQAGAETAFVASQVGF